VEAERTAIENTLRDLALTGQNTFPVVLYDNFNRMHVLDEGSIIPSSVEIEEVGKEFVPDSRYGRGMKSRVSQWRFTYVLGFENNVVLEGFEQVLADNVIIPRNTDDGCRQITLRLIDSDVSRPPRGGANDGTRVVYTIEAELERN
jgi:hypothetical protein